METSCVNPDLVNLVKLVNQLTEKHEATRIQAAAALSAIDAKRLSSTPNIWKQLVLSLFDNCCAVRESICLTIARTAHNADVRRAISAQADAVDLLVQLLEDVSSVTRDAAAFAIGQLAIDGSMREGFSTNPRAVPRLFELREDPEPRVRGSCAFALERINCINAPNAAAELVRILEMPSDDDEENMLAAVQTISCLARHDDVTVQASKRAIGTPAVMSRLVALFQHPNADVRRIAVICVGSLVFEHAHNKLAFGTPHAIEQLLLLARDEVEEVRLEAVSTLQDVLIRCNANFEMAMNTTPNVLEVLAQHVLTSRSPAIRRCGTEAVARFVFVIFDDSQRSAACRQQRQQLAHDTPDLVRRVERLLFDPDESVRAEAVLAVRSLSIGFQPNAAVLATAKNLRQLGKMVTCGSRKARTDAAATLNMLVRQQKLVPDPQLLSDLVRSFTDVAVQKHLMELVSSVAFNDKGQTTCKEVIEAVGRMILRDDVVHLSEALLAIGDVLYKNPTATRTLRNMNGLLQRVEGIVVQSDGKLRASASHALLRLSPRHPTGQGPRGGRFAPHVANALAACLAEKTNKPSRLDGYIVQALEFDAHILAATPGAPQAIAQLLLKANPQFVETISALLHCINDLRSYPSCSVVFSSPAVLERIQRLQGGAAAFAPASRTRC